MVDPITVATITSAVSVLGNECLKGIAGEAGKTLWGRIKSKLGWNSEPDPAAIPAETAKKLSASPELAKEILELLHTAKGVGVVGQMVGSITAEKVVVAETITAQTFSM